jgi:hypothetical protein
LACNEFAIAEFALHDGFRSLDEGVWHRAAVNDAQGFTLPYEVEAPTVFTGARFPGHNAVNTDSLSLPLAGFPDDLIRIEVG